MVWNDFLFPHINKLDDVDDKPKLMELYIKHFYNEELVFEQYKLYLNAFKEIAAKKKIEIDEKYAFCKCQEPIFKQMPGDDPMCKKCNKYQTV